MFLEGFYKVGLCLSICAFHQFLLIAAQPEVSEIPPPSSSLERMIQRTIMSAATKKQHQRLDNFGDL